MHEHEHDHGDGHPHSHSHDGPVHSHGPVGEDGSAVALDAVVLDIGGDVGAAIVLLADDAVLPGEELYAQPLGDPGGRFHTGIHRRPLDGREQWTAVFPEVVEGRYELLDRTGQPMAELAVTGGAVATVDLR